MKLTTVHTGRGWAYASAILGGGISIAANVAHSFIHPHGAPAHWRPEPGAVVGAVAWPVVLFFAVETLARTPWPNRTRYHLLRWVGLPPVAFVAGLVSYRHLSGLLAHYGEDRLVYVFGPIAIDGLMVMATSALIATARQHPTPTDTHDQVVTAATPATPTTIPTPVSTPAAASTAAATTATSAKAPAAKKAPAKKATPRKAPARKAATPAPASPPTDPVVADRSDEPATPPARRQTLPPPPAQAPAPSTKDTPVATVDAAPPLKKPVPAALLTRARHLADAHHKATNETISKGALAVQLRVNSDTAEQLLAVLGLDPNQPSSPVAAVNGAPVLEPTR